MSILESPLGERLKSQQQGISLLKSFFFLPLLLVVLAEIATSMFLNGNHLVYTLDDPYIHLALAKNIHSGTYGINAGEFSAPSSSILWPFIFALVPSSMPGWDLLPLFFNLLAVFVTGSIFLRIWSVDRSDTPVQLFLFGILVAVAINAAGLVMAGMEHGVQVAATAVGVWGLVEFERTDRFPRIASLALAVGSLIRYENFAITLCACTYLAIMGRWKTALVTFLPPVIIAMAFSFWLVAHGYKALPNSVLAHSDFSSVIGRLHKGAALSACLTIALNIWYNLCNPKAWTLLLISMPVFIRSLFPRSESERRLSLFALGCVVLHLIGGHFGWYARYEIYIFSVVLILSTSFYSRFIREALNINKGSNGVQYVRVASLLVLVLLLFYDYVGVLITVPVASNDIYLQQYQMARFVRDFWRSPVGVNDLGMVALRSNSYVLDFAGLASQEALFALSEEPRDHQWMEKLAKSHNVNLVMIYTIDFPDIPKNWTLVGRLRLNVPLITPANDVVDFYIRDPSLINTLKGELQTFSRSLPEGASLEII